jgi:hypothetical protein
VARLVLSTTTDEEASWSADPPVASSVVLGTPLGIHVYLVRISNGRTYTVRLVDPSGVERDQASFTPDQDVAYGNAEGGAAGVEAELVVCGEASPAARIPKATQMAGAETRRDFITHLPAGIMRPRPLAWRPAALP